MASAVTPADVRQALLERTEIALLDLRPEAVFAGGHPLFAASMPLDRLEAQAPARLPRRSAPVVAYGTGDAETQRGITRLRELGYSNLSVLDGSIDAWADAGYELFIDVNSPSKAFGELVAERLDTPFIDPHELRAMLDSGTDVTVLDGRRFDEYRTMSIPTAASAPNATLVRHVATLPQDTPLVVVNCAGRTRSIIGTQTLVHTGLQPRVAALRNGTIGWTLAGLELDREQTRRAQGTVTARAQQAARMFADRAGVERIPCSALATLPDTDRTVYRFDVRSPEAFADGHLPGFVSAPGGQLLQETDVYAPVRGALIVLTDADGTEANVTAAWLRQMGWQVTVVDGVSPADRTSQDPESATPPMPAYDRITASELAQLLPSDDIAIIDLGLHRHYVAGHLPGAFWGSRARLLAGERERLPATRTYVVTADDPAVVAFATIDLTAVLPGRVLGLDGGTAAWSAAGLRSESGPGTELSAPLDRYKRPYEGTDVSTAAMQAYLDWEYGLVAQLERDRTHHFTPVDPA